MKGIVITPENLMRVEDFSAPLYKSVGKAVGGWIEVVHPKCLPSPYCMVVNEEGLLLSLPLNLTGSILYETTKHGCPIVGTIVLLKDGIIDGEPDIVGLDDEDIGTLGAMVSAMSGGVTWEGAVQ
nr:MAG TPA: protein of unknown function DUF3846 [Caudoviricetes sp.]